MAFSAGMTPIESQPWLEDKLNGAELPPGYAVFEFPLDDNRISAGGFIDDERIDALIAEWPPEVRETRRLGKWGSYLGSIFQTFARDVHVVSEQKERELFLKGAKADGKLPYPMRAIGTIDWGGSNPFVFLWAVKIPWLDDDWYVFDELYWDFKVRGQRRLDQFADDIKQRTTQWATVLDHSWADHDPTNAAMFASYGIPSYPANKDVLLGIETVQGRLNPRPHLVDAYFPKGRPRVHIAARCKNLLRELPGYKWAEGTEKRDARNEPQKKDDHAVDAFRYLLHSESMFDGRSRSKPVDLGRNNRRNF